jgi:hypothetical protein
MNLRLTTTKTGAARGAMALPRAYWSAPVLGMVIQRHPARGQEENR